ncbi:MAG: 50S ribosomal protein L18 [Deltaproteobacteria bacterium]|nr:50S ribosomal protein L18 [Deltaproteobacteria bacterium]
MALAKKDMWKRRKLRIRKKVQGTDTRPRLTIFRSGKHIYAQLVDDTQGRTIVAASTVEKELKAAHCNKDFATQVGKLVAERAKQAKIAQVVFDRNGYRYHGCVKALADGVRDGGLKF